MRNRAPGAGHVSTSGRRDAGVVVPLRSFTGSKARLASVLDGDARAALAREMAEQVRRAAGDRDIVVVSSAPEVRTWARAQGCACVDDPGTLDLAADAGRAWARDRGHARVVIVHADLPRASTLDTVAGGAAEPIAVIVPDHRDDGTPVLSLPAAVPFTFSYGLGSFRRHVAQARRDGLAVRIVRDAALGFDLDLPEDLRALHQPTP